ncbi:MAG: hypothetical protein HOP33_21830 [Verrucomicrobia bacterium]|nr:hypothetical protein [Verrucomicrobiota bacterium]
MFAISVPIFVLMAVYGHYGKQLEKNSAHVGRSEVSESTLSDYVAFTPYVPGTKFHADILKRATANKANPINQVGRLLESQFQTNAGYGSASGGLSLEDVAFVLTSHANARVYFSANCRPTDHWPDTYSFSWRGNQKLEERSSELEGEFRELLGKHGVVLFKGDGRAWYLLTTNEFAEVRSRSAAAIARPLEEKIFMEAVAGWPEAKGLAESGLSAYAPPQNTERLKVANVSRAADIGRAMADARHWNEAIAKTPATIGDLLREYWRHSDKSVFISKGIRDGEIVADFRMETNSILSHAGFLDQIEAGFRKQGIVMASLPGNTVLFVTESDIAKLPSPVGLRKPLPEKAPADSTWLSPFGPLTTKAAKAAKLSPEEAKPYSLLYTYSLIIALVCGTAGLPHILVRFYTNPDGVAAKRTTMWVMILIGIFYVFPPVFGVMGRNLMPELYTGLSGMKGTDQVVLKLPTLLNEKFGVLGSILSGITCAGAFAAFMSTFSGLLVSMTGALAHDVYGRMLRPKSTPQQRMRMFKISAVIIGGVAMLLGSFVEPLEINFMVGQAFAIAAASYFPLLFMSVWWRGMTMRGAAVGMLTGGLCALVAAALTNVSNLALDKGPMGKIFAGFAGMNDFWAHHPLLRILCEQPAIWTVPLAITLMIVVSKATRKEVPSDVRMKMLVLHAPEKLGLKQEYIQEHQGGH